MALKPNPLTGELEDDGLPTDPLAVSDVPATPSDTMSEVTPGTNAGSGSRSATPTIPVLPDGTLPVTISGSQKPASETTTQTQYKVKGKDTVAAEQALTEARTAADQAQQPVTEIEAQEDNLRANAAEQKRNELAAQKEKARIDEEERRNWVEQARQQDEQEIAEEKKARLASGNADQSYWEGRPGAEVFTRILQAVGGALHFVSGGQGEDPVSRTLRGYKAAHEKRLVTAWEATKEANALKKANREAYEEELAKRRIAAANQNKLSLDLIDEEMNASIAALSPDKRRAAQELYTRVKAESRAEEDRKVAQGYDVLKSREQVNRTLPPAADAKAQQNADKVKVTVGGKDFTVRGSEAEPGKIRDKAAATETLRRQLDEYDALLAEGANPLTTGMKRAGIETKLANLTAKIKGSEQLGTLDNGVQALVNGLVGNPLDYKSVFSGGAEGVRLKVRETKKAALESVRDTLATHGNDPAEVSAALGLSGDSQGGGASEAKDYTKADLDKLPAGKVLNMRRKARELAKTDPAMREQLDFLEDYIRSKGM